MDAVTSIHFINNKHEDDRESEASGRYNQAICPKLYEEMRTKEPCIETFLF